MLAEGQLQRLPASTWLFGGRLDYWTTGVRGIHSVG